MVLEKQIIQKLNEMGIEVFDSYYLKDKKTYAILAEKAIIHYEVGGKNITVTFHVATFPEFVAKFILHLKEIEGVNIEVAESFWYGDNSQLLSGKEAYDRFEEVRKMGIIEEFIKEQTTMHALSSVKCYHA